MKKTLKDIFWMLVIVFCIVAMVAVYNGYGHQVLGASLLGLMGLFGIAVGLTGLFFLFLPLIIIGLVMGWAFKHGAKP